MYIFEPSKQITAHEFDVVVAGGGTAGVVAAIAAAREGKKTALIESKGYVGGTIVEGGTALHSFFNIWKAFPGVEKRQVVKGIPAEIIERVTEAGGATGFAEMVEGYDYDSVCTAIDTEIYKYVVFEMLREAGVYVYVNSFLSDVVMDGKKIKAAIIDGHSGREALAAKAFIDCTGYGDLSALAGADFTEPNDHDVANSIGVSGVSLEKYHKFLKDIGALKELVYGKRDGAEDRIIRLDGYMDKFPQEFVRRAREIGMSTVTTTLHDDYFMFIKLNYHIPTSVLDHSAVSEAEFELRRRQIKAVELLRDFIPGCEKAFITRTSPSLCIRRARLIACDYDMTLEDIIEGRHFEDDVLTYGFHDSAPRIQIKNGGAYGLPYRALLVSGIDNLLAAGMMITSDHEAHMSTRNTVSCMAQGQAAGTAAALCAAWDIGTRELKYPVLREALLKGGVVLEN